MRYLTLVAAALFCLSACDSNTAPSIQVSPESAPSAPKPASATQPHQQLPTRPGLRLEVRLTSPKPAEIGGPLTIAARLVNVSKAPMKVVTPGDGSNFAWREPRMRLTAEHSGSDGVFRAMPKPSFGRCGNYDADWNEDVVSLAPGASLDLDWLPHPVTWLDLHDPGQLRLRLHYRYEGGADLPSGVKAPATLAEVKPFELVSNTIEVVLTRPLELRLEVLDEVRAGPTIAFDELVRVTVINHSTREHELKSPVIRFGDNVRFELNEDAGTDEPDVKVDFANAKKTATVAPGQSTVVFGKDSVFDQSHSGWSVAEPDTLRIRAHYRGLQSNWARVNVR
jgi:hypothetical protein